ncbi:MAG: T9SS type A sorting domain-containing protein [Ignavibacteria bacterium]|nr:T9SS type A sorting domain-containing protein [Ignavibacteria bacterium]
MDYILTPAETVFFNPITSINEFSIIENPSFYKLFQNFPNPFNPKTKISFELQKAGNVKLTVYDIQGKNIAVLVNGKKQTGNYEVEFDGSNLSSGVYFYRLEISGKKIILIQN